jgi:outer membrane lipoprotein-sorting protein
MLVALPMKKIILSLLSFFMIVATVQASDPAAVALLASVKKKYDLVNDYSARARLVTNVIFIKAPVSQVTVYYRKPDQLLVKNEKGISFIPKGTVHINMNNGLGLTNFEAVLSGTETIDGVLCTVVKIFPLSEEESITRATLYIDPTKLLVRRSVVSTKESGTYSIRMKYGSYSWCGLPSEVAMEFNTRDYKLPKGTTLDYDNGTPKASGLPQKGKVLIQYQEYTLNKGLPASLFR